MDSSRNITSLPLTANYVGLDRRLLSDNLYAEGRHSQQPASGSQKMVDREFAYRACKSL